MKLSVHIDNHVLNAYWKWFLVWGIAVFLLGAIAISAATFTTLASVIFIGLIISLCGAIILVDTFTFWWRKWPGFALHLILGLLYLGFGLMLINQPLLGSATLTLFLGIFLIIVGTGRILYSLSLRVSQWQWSFLSGFVSLLLGILIITNLSSASLFIIGFIVGVDLLFSGLAYIMMALSVRSLSY